MSEPRILKKRYRLGPRIGLGGTGKVYLAEDLEEPGAGRVAVKRITADDNTTMERARREAHALQVLTHPDIPAIRDYWVDENWDDTMYLVMDFVPGRTLAKIM